MLEGERAMYAIRHCTLLKTVHCAKDSGHKILYKRHWTLLLRTLDTRYGTMTLDTRHYLKDTIHS